MMKKDYIEAVKIFIKQKSNLSVSISEIDKLNDLIAKDREFEKIISRIKDGDYLKEIEDYCNNKIEDKIRLKVTQRIDAIKKSRRRNKFFVMTGCTAAVIALFIGIGVGFVKNDNINQIKEIEKVAVNKEPSAFSSVKDIILISGEGENIKLTGTIYNVKSNSPIDSMVVKPVISTVIVPVKKEFNIILPDGTTVWLNSCSKLTFPDKFDSAERVVEFEGEAFFDVAPNAEKPFVVHGKIMNTKVLGTKFIISAYDDNSTSGVSLIEGGVEVSSTISDYTQILKPGKGVVFDAAKRKFKSVDININNTMARMNGMLVFENDKLSDICNILSKCYDVKFIINEQWLKDKQFYIKTKKYDSIEIVMDLLVAAGGISYKINNDTITIF